MPGAVAQPLDRRAGLGLTIARNVGETHGGRLTLETAPSGGARIVIVLSLFQPRAAARHSTAA